MILRIELPFHLRTLAKTGNEVQVEVAGEPTIAAALDALEAGYPVLRGTIRDVSTGRRRAFVRFYACEQDLSLEPLETLLPAAVVNGSEPLLIIGAIAGG